MLSERDIRVLFLFHFKKGLNATTTAKEINELFGPDFCCERTIRRWFLKFSKGDFCLENAARGKPLTTIDDEDLRMEVEHDPSTTLLCLAQRFQVSIATISRHIKKIGKVKKLDRWVPYELTQIHKNRRLEVTSSLLKRHHTAPFLKCIITCDEKWILYDNRKRKRQWLDKSEASRTHAKANIYSSKIMVTVWWSSEGIIHYSFLEPGKTITAESYCRELQIMHEKLCVKQPSLVNRHKPILLHDNARPHVAKITVAKLKDLGYEVLAHPPYSPDLSPTDFHLFRSLANFMRNQRYITRASAILAFQDFLASKNKDFFKKGIFSLPDRWQQTIDSNGDYFI